MAKNIIRLTEQDLHKIVLESIYAAMDKLTEASSTQYADRNRYIKKSHIRAVEKFAEELRQFAAETGEEEPTLYEDQYTSFTLSNPRVEDGYLVYNYDGRLERENMVREQDGEIWEEEYFDSIMAYVRFWKSCLRRARRYWEMDIDRLDALQDPESGVVDDDDEDNF